MLTAGLLNVYIQRQAESELKKEGDIIASAVDMDGGRFLDNTNFSDMRVTWIASGGRVIFDNVKSPDSLENHYDREEVIEAIEKGEGTSSRYSDTIMKTTVNYAVRLSDGSIIRVSVLNDSFFSHVAGMLTPLFCILSAVTLFAALLASRMARSIVKPINEIDLKNPNTKKSYKELAPLLKKLKAQNRRINRQMDELRQSREQFSLITEHMAEGLAIADPKGVVLTCNSSMYALLNIEKRSDRQSIFLMNNTADFRRCIQDALGGRRSECIVKTENGERKVIASPAHSKELINGIVMFVLDVTEEQELETMRREFTSNVSHELKTPLTTIYGISDMLASGIVKPEDVPSFGNDIKSEADRMIILINDIISLSKLDEDSVPRKDEPVDIYVLSQEITQRLSRAAKEKGISYDVYGEHVTVTGNRTVIDEIICNLCDNAIKYNNYGGHYEVGISGTQKKAVITVRDTGEGISQEHINRIFERFYRVDKSRSRKIKGTGLGLSIVKHGVMYCGGSVRVESTAGEGCIFTVELPLENRKL